MPKANTADNTNPLRAGLSSRRIAEPCTIVVFGATGDLTARKLMPALYNLSRDGHLPQRFAIVGAARRDWSDEHFRNEMGKAIQEHSRNKPRTDSARQDFLERLYYQSVNFAEASDYARLRDRLDQLDKQNNIPPNRLYYLSIAPEFFTEVTSQIKASGLIGQDPDDSNWNRLIIEKPFGHDLTSAQQLNRHLQSVFREPQVYRIDHYLGKETVQNMLAFRFANAIFEPLWNSRYVQQVEITVCESLGMEGRRGQYYDKAGALRDMVQNHLLQLLCLVAMEPPANMDAESLRDEKVRLLRAIPSMDRESVRQGTVRGQYGQGSMEGEVVNAYREEDQVDGSSTTETYVAMRIGIHNWRWPGVPFLLRTGKRLPKRASEVAVTFRRPPHLIFGSEREDAQRNTLVLRIQPDEGISLSFEAKQPGLQMNLQKVKMEFRYGSSFGQPSPEAYERLLLDCLTGDASLFTRADEVEQAWRIVTAIQQGWSELPDPDFPNYEAGTWGPEEADRLVQDLSKGWRKL